MKIKCGRKEIELNSSDVIMYNGACYQIVTRMRGGGWNTFYPIIAIARAKKLIKEGLLIEFEKNNSYKECIYYKIKEENQCGEN